MQANVDLLLLIISLLFGFFFFIYALRYYIAVLNVVIKLLRGNNSMKNRANGGYRTRLPSNNDYAEHIKSWRIINHANGNAPFISIHVALYNEKNVVDRLMKALTSLNYPNYEIIVVDDSRDETREILMKRWSRHPRVKIVRREERRGFKAGALREALRHMNPLAEYVVVFDADFIPPPNILWQLLAEIRNGYSEGNGNEQTFKSRANNLVNAVEDRDIIRERSVVAVQGYQWHILNARENWITLAVRSEYAGNYLVERPLVEAADGIRMISGSVFMIRADILRRYKWRDSLTEDWDLTLRLYRDGYRVKYSFIAAAPAECPSTLMRLIRQRMRWAEGHTFAVKRYLFQILTSRMLSIKEKLEFLYLAPYYFNSIFFLIGTTAWFLRELLRFETFFWTSVFGWSLLLSNMIAVPLMNLTGLYMEYSARGHWRGALSWLILMHIIAPFQAIAALKGLLETKEGTWFRTLKTGKITESLLFRIRGIGRLKSKHRKTIKLSGKRIHLFLTILFSFILSVLIAPAIEDLVSTRLLISFTLIAAAGNMVNVRAKRRWRIMLAGTLTFLGLITLTPITASINPSTISTIPLLTLIVFFTLSSSVRLFPKLVKKDVKTVLTSMNKGLLTSSLCLLLAALLFASPPGLRTVDGVLADNVWYLFKDTPSGWTYMMMSETPPSTPTSLLQRGDYWDLQWKSIEDYYIPQPLDENFTFIIKLPFFTKPLGVDYMQFEYKFAIYQDEGNILLCGGDGIVKLSGDRGEIIEFSRECKPFRDIDETTAIRFRLSVNNLMCVISSDPTTDQCDIKYLLIGLQGADKSMLIYEGELVPENPIIIGLAALTTTVIIYKIKKRREQERRKPEIKETSIQIKQRKTDALFVKVYDKIFNSYRRMREWQREE